jgi:hypothetical protein
MPIRIIKYSFIIVNKRYIKMKIKKKWKCHLGCVDKKTSTLKMK